MFLSSLAAAGSGAGGFINIAIGLLWGSIGLLLYFIPTFVARKKQHPQKTAILIVNIFLGWTFIGWVIALVWAVMKQPTATEQLPKTDDGQ